MRCTNGCFALASSDVAEYVSRTFPPQTTQSLIGYAFVDGPIVREREIGTTISILRFRKAVD